jgi:L-ribulokinase
MMGMEAGQSAFGDVYAWFSDVLSYPLNNLLDQSPVINETTAELLRRDLHQKIIMQLSSDASKIPLCENDELAVDWLNGRRTPDANQLLKGAVTALNLGSDAPRIFKALVEATCFGAKAIVERFNTEGVEIKGLIGLGGVSKRSAYVMQTMADVMNMAIRVHKSEQTCAAGAAMFAATVAGLYRKVEDAMNAMGQGFDMTYHPKKQNAEFHMGRFERYIELGNFIEHSNTI